MCISDCCKKEFQPRKKKTGPYIPTNAYSIPMSCQMVGTLILFITQLILHSVFVVPTLDDIKHVILWILLGFTYGMLLVIIYDFIYLTTTDPVDPLVTHQELTLRYRPEQLTFCVICDKNVQMNSHHCFRCDRCTEDFDHHCKFLNNCIGGRNYQSFFRLLCVNSLYNLLMIGTCIWVLIRNFEDKSIAFTGNQWGVIVLLVLTILITLAVGILLAFHCYISLCAHQTTFTFNYPEKKDGRDFKGTPRININIFQAPKSDDRLARQEGKIIS